MLAEEDLRRGLRALTATPEPLSYDLAERSASRAIAWRRRRVALTAVAVAAAVVAAVPLTAALRTPPKPQPMAKSLRSWPEYVDRELAPAFDVARGEYERLHPDFTPPGTVRRLYVGSFRLDPSIEVLVVWAYCGPDACTRVVSATTSRAYAFTAGTDPHSSDWVMHDGEIPAGARTVPIGMLLPSRFGDRGNRTMVAVVPPPGTTRVTWSSSPRWPGTGGSGDLVEDPHGGLWIADAGFLSSPLRITVGGRSPFEGPAELPGEENPNQGNARLPAKVHVPAPYQAEISGQHQTDEPFLFFVETPHGSRMVVVAVCEGVGSVTLKLEGVTGTLPCDGTERLVLQDVPVSGQVEFEILAAGPYDGVAFEVGYR